MLPQLCIFALMLCCANAAVANPRHVNVKKPPTLARSGQANSKLTISTKLRPTTKPRPTTTLRKSDSSTTAQREAKVASTLLYNLRDSNGSLLRSSESPPNLLLSKFYGAGKLRVLQSQDGKRKVLWVPENGALAHSLGTLADKRFQPTTRQKRFIKRKLGETASASTRTLQDRSDAKLQDHTNEGIQLASGDGIKLEGTVSYRLWSSGGSHTNYKWSSASVPRTDHYGHVVDLQVPKHLVVRHELKIRGKKVEHHYRIARRYPIIDLRGFSPTIPTSLIGHRETLGPGDSQRAHDKLWLEGLNRTEPAGIDSFVNFYSKGGADNLSKIHANIFYHKNVVNHLHASWTEALRKVGFVDATALGKLQGAEKKLATRLANDVTIFKGYQGRGWHLEGLSTLSDPKSIRTFVSAYHKVAPEAALYQIYTEGFRRYGRHKFATGTEGIWIKELQRHGFIPRSASHKQRDTPRL